MPAWLTNVLAVLGTLGLSVAAVVTAAYGLFRLFSDKWLSAKFSERLEGFKHAQQRQMEHLRLEINAALDRTTKLHQYEFEALPELWAKLNKAFGAVASFLSPLQHHPDLSRMSAPQLETFLKNADLEEWHKDELRSSRDKTRNYIKISFWYTLNKVYTDYNDFNNYFVVKGIFLEDGLKQQISKLRDMMFGALIERQHEEEHPDPRPGRFAEGEKLRKEGRQALDEIGQSVRARLWDARLLVTTPS
ncbi:hypothetical protein [Sphingobium sp. ZW T5_29]|uniref:hypothetical protein n=1 Tax=Sphingobium sp. ZW T5_29 TaxID=3378077 RepID=UPI003854221D